MSIDYEKEYDSRARVPEYPEIFARRDREAEAYRQATAGAALGLSYGPTPRQTIDLFPVKDGPLALFVHGGWWRSLGPESFSHMAKGPNAYGVGLGVVGYDLCPQVSVAAIIEEMRAACLFLWRRLGQRISVYGNSAGGHLVACLVATDFSKLAADAPADLVPAGCGISGIYDAAPAVQISVNQDLRLTAEEACRISPVHWRVLPGRTSTRWSAGTSRASSSVKRKTISRPGGRRVRRLATGRSPAPITSPSPTRSPIPTAL